MTRPCVFNTTPSFPLEIANKYSIAHAEFSPVQTQRVASILPAPHRRPTTTEAGGKQKLLLFTMCCRGLFNCCWQLCVSVICAGLFVLLYWAIFQPHHIRATVASAALSNLTVVSNEVSYSLAVSLSLYNPSVRVNIYYDTIGAELRFRDAVLGPAATGASPSEFYQRRKTSDDVKLDFDYARSSVAVGSDVAGELEKEMRSGSPLSLELDVELRVRYVFRIFKLRQKPRIWCSLSIPVKAEGRGPGVGGAVAPGDRCRVKY